MDGMNYLTSSESERIYALQIEFERDGLENAKD